MSTFTYGLKQGVKNIWQNRLFSLAAVGTIATCLFLLGMFYALLSNFQNMIYNAESNVGITVFFEPGITDEQIAYIGDEIRACKNVEKVTFISAEEAWDSFKEDISSEEAGFEDTFGTDNPLEDSASYEVYLSEVDTQQSIMNFIKKIDGVRKVNGSNTLATGLSNFNMLVGYISGSIIILLLLVSVFLIHTAVATGIRVRKDEILIMQYIGATDVFIKLPFVLEGIFIGCLGAVIPLALLLGLYGRLISFILKHFSVLSQWLTFVTPQEEFQVLVPLLLLVGVGIGFLGSTMSVRKHLRHG